MKDLFEMIRFPLLRTVRMTRQEWNERAKQFRSASARAADAKIRRIARLSTYRRRPTDGSWREIRL